MPAATPYTPAEDLKLRSGEEVFPVHSTLLSLASGVFKTMLSLPQPSSSEPGEIPIIDVSEPPEVLGLLLKFIYPVPDPIIDDDLDTLILVLEAAWKYEVPSAIQSLRKQLVSEQYLEQFSTRIYAVAVFHDFEQEAKLASKHTLGIKLLDRPPPKELELISAISYHRLLALHQSRASAARSLLKLRDDVKCMQCDMYGAFSGGPEWWLDFKARAHERLKTNPTTDGIFTLEFLSKSLDKIKCHKCPLSLVQSWSFLEELKQKMDELPDTI